MNLSLLYDVASGFIIQFKSIFNTALEPLNWVYEFGLGCDRSEVKVASRSSLLLGVMYHNAGTLLMFYVYN